MELPQGKKVLIFVFNLTNITQTGIEVSFQPPPPSPSYFILLNKDPTLYLTYIITLLDFFSLKVY